MSVRRGGAKRTDLNSCSMYISKDDRISVLDIHYLAGTTDRVEHVVENDGVGLFDKSPAPQAP